MEAKEKPCSCACGWAGVTGELRYVRFDALAPGEIMPLGVCPKCQSKILPVMAFKPPRVAITIEGGSIQVLESDAPVDILTVDYDVEDDANPDHVFTIGNGEAVVLHYDLREWKGGGVNVENTARIFSEYEARMKPAAAEDVVRP